MTVSCFSLEEEEGEEEEVGLVCLPRCSPERGEGEEDAPTAEGSSRSTFLMTVRPWLQPVGGSGAPSQLEFVLNKSVIVFYWS